jgi:hypothetical protein
VTAELSKLPPQLPTLTIEQIQKVVRKEQSKRNFYLEQAQKESRERQYKKEKENFTNWMKEQWKQVEQDAGNRLREKSDKQHQSPQPSMKKKKERHQVI